MKYQVIVGNIGTVYDGSNEKEATKHFREYKRQSERGLGRAGCEPVTLMEDNEVKREHLGIDLRA